MMYRSTGDDRVKQRIDYIIGELATCQAQDPSGLVTAIPDAKTIFGKIAADGTVTGWVPWYTTHKVMAGIRDSYLLAGNAGAKPVLIGLADWANALTANLTDAQFQAMLDTEHGGMNEVLADVYAFTGDTKYLDFAKRFCHQQLLIPFSRGTDMLNGYHSNTQIPKFIGFARLYELTGEPVYGNAAKNFWHAVLANRSYAIGGNGDYEHFFAPEQFSHHLASECTSETCSTYNMLRLTRSLYRKSGAPELADYYERAVTNNILSSQDPVKGMMSYFSPTKPGHFKVYCTPENSFWCCTGTGIENHSKYGDSIYFHGENSLTVNLYVASQLRWNEKGLTVTQETQFPLRDSSRLTIECAKPTSLTVRLRHPYWAQTMSVRINGRAVKPKSEAGSFAEISRTWHSGDVVDVSMPMALHTDQPPHAPGHVAIMFGPLVMAGAMGTAGMERTPAYVEDQTVYQNLPAINAPALVADAESDITAKIKPVDMSALTFKTSGLGQPNDITLVPFYSLHHQRYNMYWSWYTPADWEKQKQALLRDEAKQAEIDKLTVDQYLPGNQQSDVDHKMDGNNTRSGSFNDKTWRDAIDGWFSFQMKVDPAAQQVLLCTFWGDEVGARSFDLLVDGTQVGTETLNQNKPGQFFDQSYDLPLSLTHDKTVVTVKLQAHAGNMAGGLYGARIVRQAKGIL
jgi:DUF1680 family protein